MTSGDGWESWGSDCALGGQGGVPAPVPAFPQREILTGDGAGGPGLLFPTRILMDKPSLRLLFPALPGVWRIQTQPGARAGCFHDRPGEFFDPRPAGSCPVSGRPHLPLPGPCPALGGPGSLQGEPRGLGHGGGVKNPPDTRKVGWELHGWGEAAAEEGAEIWADSSFLCRALSQPSPGCPSPARGVPRGHQDQLSGRTEVSCVPRKAPLRHREIPAEPWRILTWAR